MKGEIELVYVILEYTGILLFLFLLGHCIYKSINYTLQIFCIIAIFNNINESILLFFHDYDSHNNQQYRQQGLGGAGASVYGTLGCTVSAFFEQLLPLMMNCLASCMAFNIWYLVVLRARHTERELVKWYAVFAVVVAGIPTCVAAVLLRDEPYFTAYPRQFYCNLADGPVTKVTFAGLMLAVAIPGILLSLHTVVFLVQHYVLVRKTLVFTLASTSNVVIELSHCIRLLVFCVAFGTIVIMAVLQALVDPRTLETMTNNNISHQSFEGSSGTGTGAGASGERRGDHHGSLAMFSEFSGSLVGFFVFLVFGTTQDALKTLGKVVCCRFGSRACGRATKDRKQERRLEEFRGQQGEQGHGSRLGYGFFEPDLGNAAAADGDDAVYYNFGDLSHDRNESIKNNHNYTDMYLGNDISSYSNNVNSYSNNVNSYSNNVNSYSNNINNGGPSDYRYHYSDFSLSSTQFRDKYRNNFNSAGFDNQYATNNHSRSSESSSSNINSNNTTTSAITLPTPTANTTTATTSSNIDSSSNIGNITRKRSMNSSNKRLPLPSVEIGPIPPPPLKPLPERPTFQELMMHDFYHTNSNERHSINRNSSRHGQRRRSSSSSRSSSNDLKSELSSELLPASLLPPPPPAVYSPK